MSATDSTNELCAALSPVLLRHGVRLAILFGSRANGKARPTSDVDLALDADDAQFAVIAGELSSTLGLEVDVVSLKGVTIPLLEALIRDGIVVHEGRRGAGASWRSKALAELETDRPWYARTRDAWIARVAERGLGRGR